MKKIKLLMAMLLISTAMFSQVGIQTATPSATLDIVSSGSTNTTKALEINNSSATEMVTVLDNGNVGIGTTTPGNAKLNVQGAVSIGSDENSPWNVNVSGYVQAGEFLKVIGRNNTVNGREGMLTFRDHGALSLIQAGTGAGDISIIKSRGTLNSPVDVVDGDEIGGISFRPYIGGGNTFLKSAFIKAYADGTPGTNMPMRIGFLVPAANVGTNEVVSIKPIGHILNVGNAVTAGSIYVANNTYEVPWLFKSSRTDNTHVIGIRATDTNDDGGMTFWTGDLLGTETEKVRIRANGNVGIGTTTPVGKLDVSGGYIVSDNNYGLAGKRTDGTVASIIKVDASNQTRISSPSAADVITINGQHVGVNVVTTTSTLAIGGLAIYADNAAAIAGGLVAGDLYRTATGVLMVVF